jgi:hypothetical protein
MTRARPTTSAAAPTPYWNGCVCREISCSSWEERCRFSTCPTWAFATCEVPQRRKAERCPFHRDRDSSSGWSRANSPKAGALSHRWPASRMRFNAGIRSFAYFHRASARMDCGSCSPTLPRGQHCWFHLSSRPRYLEVSARPASVSGLFGFREGNGNLPRTCGGLQRLSEQGSLHGFQQRTRD